MSKDKVKTASDAERALDAVDGSSYTAIGGLLHARVAGGGACVQLQSDAPGDDAGAVISVLAADYERVGRFFAELAAHVKLNGAARVSG